MNQLVPPGHGYRLRMSMAAVALRILAVQLLLVIAAIVMAVMDLVFQASLVPPWLVFLVLAIIDLVATAKIILGWFRVVYVVRPGEVIILRGLLRLREDIYELRALNAIEVERGFWGRLLDYGTIRLTGSGSSPEGVMLNVPDPVQYASIIRQGRNMAELDSPAVRTHQNL